jgi:hypothetical protein
MKNITVAVTDRAYKYARIWAVNHDTSISGIVQIFLEGLASINTVPNVGNKIAHARRVALALDKSADKPAEKSINKPADQSPAPQPNPRGAVAPAPSITSPADFLLGVSQRLCTGKAPQTKQTTSSAPEPD